MTISQTSLSAYESLQPSISGSQMAVLRKLREIGPTNNRLLAEGLGWPINRVTGRVHELEADGIVIQTDVKVDALTRRPAKVWMAAKGYKPVLAGRG